ncbi:23921_t:CDS:1, partial [Racocetra persica]
NTINIDNTNHFKPQSIKTNTYPNINYQSSSQQYTNEFKDYIKGRYLSAPEAAWRIFRYHITSTNPPVQALPIHLFNTNIPQYSRSYNTSTVSLLNRYFFQPPESLFDKLKYTEYYEQYLLYPFKQQDVRESDFLEQEQAGVLRKIVRKRTTNKITRIVLIAPGSGELFYLRCILMHRAVRTWDEIKVFNNIAYSTYQETAREMGLFANENE